MEVAKKSLVIIRVAFLYLLFGFICLLGDFIFIFIVVFGLNKFKIVRNFCRDLVRVSWAFFIKICKISGYLSFKFDDFNLGKKGELIIANHPSLLDVVFFLSKIKHLNCVVKGKLGQNIFLAFAIKACGYISNRNDDELLTNCLNALQNGESLLIFPEGTRTKDTIMLHKASFYIAIKQAITLRVMHIIMKPQSLKGWQKWYDVPTKTINYEFKNIKNYDIKQYNLDRADPVRVRLLFNEVCEIYKELK